MGSGKDRIHYNGFQLSAAGRKIRRGLQSAGATGEKAGMGGRTGQAPAGGATAGSRTGDGKEYIKKLATIDFLFIDDLGAERVQSKDGDLWLQEKMFDVVNKRYNAKRPTIFTSNYSLQELITKVGIHERTVDRIAEMSNAIIKIEGESYRMKARSEMELPF